MLLCRNTCSLHMTTGSSCSLCHSSTNPSSKTSSRTASTNPPTACRTKCLVTTASLRCRCCTCIRVTAAGSTEPTYLTPSCRTCVLVMRWVWGWVWGVGWSGGGVEWVEWSGCHTLCHCIHDTSPTVSLYA